MENQKNETSEPIDGLSFSKDSVIITDTEVYKIELLGDVLENELMRTFDGDDNLIDNESFKDDVAYIQNNYYYLYRGECKGSKKGLKPGIYKSKSSENENKYFIVDPKTDYEKELYDVTTHVASLNPVSIIDVANTKEDILVAIPESTKIFQPTLNATDDILKRVAKEALIVKNVDLDRYKDRFKDKNALFNFKQVIRGDNKLSILIFDRGMEALNLKYTIVIEERDDVNYVGNRLTKPIKVSSEDTYDI